MNTLRLLSTLSHRPQFVPSVRYAPKSRRMKPKDNSAQDIVPKNIMKFTTAPLQKDNGVPYDSKPFKMYLEAGKVYTWCLCGQSHTQPLCDATHRFYLWDIKLRPIRFMVNESKEYWLCCCKQTKNRPFCDGSHRSPEIQDACKHNFTCTG